MNTIEAMREFLGWCSVINNGVLTFSAIVVISLRGLVSRIHAKLFKRGIPFAPVTPRKCLKLQDLLAFVAALDKLHTFSVIRPFTGVKRIAPLFNLDESDISRAYFQYLAQYKIAIIVFNIVPYFALWIMS